MKSLLFGVSLALTPVTGYQIGSRGVGGAPRKTVPLNPIPTVTFDSSAFAGKATTQLSSSKSSSSELPEKIWNPSSAPLTKLFSETLGAILPGQQVEGGPSENLLLSAASYSPKPPTKAAPYEPEDESSFMSGLRVATKSILIPGYTTSEESEQRRKERRKERREIISSSSSPKENASKEKDFNAGMLLNQFFGDIRHATKVFTMGADGNSGGNTPNNNNGDGDDDDKFSMAQRIESAKCAVTGAVTGAVGAAPFTLLHSLVSSSNPIAAWEFATDMAALQAALFTLVYRYAIREDKNPMLNQGVLGAFVLARTLSTIQVSDSCSAVPLQCGALLGYFDWNMIVQGALTGAESVALFGAAALAMEVAFKRRWISKFP